MKGKYLVTGISFPEPELLELAKAVAKKQRRSVANLICGLLEDYLANTAVNSSQEKRGDNVSGKNQEEVVEIVDLKPLKFDKPNEALRKHHSKHRPTGGSKRQAGNHERRSAKKQ